MNDNLTPVQNLAHWEEAISKDSDKERFFEAIQALDEGDSGGEQGEEDSSSDSDEEKEIVEEEAEADIEIFSDGRIRWVPRWERSRWWFDKFKRDTLFEESHPTGLT